MTYKAAKTFKNTAREELENQVIEKHNRYQNKTTYQTQGKSFIKKSSKKKKLENQMELSHRRRMPSGTIFTKKTLAANIADANLQTPK